MLSSQVGEGETGRELTGQGAQEMPQAESRGQEDARAGGAGGDGTMTAADERGLEGREELQRAGLRVPAPSAGGSWGARRAGLSGASGDSITSAHILQSRLHLSGRLLHRRLQLHARLPPVRPAVPPPVSCSPLAIRARRPSRPSFLEDFPMGGQEERPRVPRPSG